jgi:hypothetical protein
LLAKARLHRDTYNVRGFEWATRRSVQLYWANCCSAPARGLLDWETIEKTTALFALHGLAYRLALRSEWAGTSEWEGALQGMSELARSHTVLDFAGVGLGGAGPDQGPQGIPGVCAGGVVLMPPLSLMLLPQSLSSLPFGSGGPLLVDPSCPSSATYSSSALTKHRNRGGGLHAFKD